MVYSLTGYINGTPFMGVIIGFVTKTRIVELLIYSSSLLYIVGLVEYCRSTTTLEDNVT